MTELDDAAITSIVKLAEAQKLLHVVHADGEPDHVYSLVKNDGTVVPCTATPPPRCHSVFDVAHVVQEANRFKDLGFDPVVWYSHASVFVLDDVNRRDRSVLQVSFTPQFLTLKNLESSRKAMDQKTFVRLLRIDLAACLAPTGNLLPLLRQLKFINSREGSSTLAPSKESLSRSVVAEVSGVDVIPELTTLAVRVFDLPDGPGVKSVVCAIEVEPQTETFQLIPLPGELTNAVRDAEAAIGERLRAELSGATIPVIYGLP